MEIKYTNGNGQIADAGIELSDSAFAQPFNEDLIHQVVTAYMAAGRAGTKGQKTRSEVRGGGQKPFRQKGTGRARAGTIRSPLWRGGGKTFAAENRDFSQKVNRKMYRGAIRSILSELVRQDRLMIVESLLVEAPKTKQLAQKLKGMGIGNVLIVTDSLDDNLYLSARNLPEVEVRTARGVDPVSLIRFDKVLMTAPAVKQMEEMLA